MLSLLSTKLYLPKIRPHLVKRNLLLEKLNMGVSSGSHFILISASAGYGKTTLIAEWLGTLQSSSSWLSLDEGDNDPVRFFTYLLASCKKANDGLCHEAEALLQDASPLALKGIVTELINDLCRLQEGINIVLDDYHVIQNPVIHEVVQFLIESVPAGSLLIMLTRQDPPFSLSKLRVRNQITEIRSNDLRFKKDETLAFFLETMRIPMDSEDLEKLTDRTEGWIAGLQLAAITLRNYDPDKAHTFIDEFNGNNQYVIDYLMDEILKHQDAERTEFLCMTAILKRLCAPLCEYITGRANSRDILQGLEKDNLFLIPLDGNREWYRYHHLFADSLKTRLEDHQKATLFIKASRWFEANHFFHEAIDYSFLAKDYQNTLRLIELVQGELFENGQLTTLMQWIDLIPDDVLRTSEFLYVRKAWIYTITGRIKDAYTHMSTMNEAYIASLSPANRGVHISLLATFAAFREDEETAHLAEQALSLIGDSEPMVRTVTLNTLAGAKIRTGHISEAIRASKEAFELGEKKLGYSFATLLALGNLIQSLVLSGSRDEAESLLLRIMNNQDASRSKAVPVLGIIYSNMASVLYERNTLEDALHYAQKGVELLRNASLHANSTLELTLALILSAMGEFKESMDVLDRYEKSVNPIYQAKMIDRISSIRAEINLRMNRLDMVGKWAEEQDFSVSDQPSYLKETSYITYSRLLLMEIRLKEARILLEGLERNALQSGRTARLITIYILMAILHFLENQEVLTRTYIEKAVHYARNGNYYRAFLDEGNTVSGLIAKYMPAEPFIETLKSFFKTAKVYHFYGESNKKIKERTFSAFSDEYTEPLSDRELELLGLIASGLSNDEISSKLFITKNTTQWHITNIYSKLGVKSRTQAIARARSLNLIE